MWFAFKIFDLWCREQQHYPTMKLKTRCDLLSKFSIFDVVNNVYWITSLKHRVVICFQNFRSLMSWTTRVQLEVVINKLWFAFKIFDLWCREQLFSLVWKIHSSCDLLSKFSIFDVVNNPYYIGINNKQVVICFQNFRSLMSWTTGGGIATNPVTLWFAFKIFDLWCREQLKVIG